MHVQTHCRDTPQEGYVHVPLHYLVVTQTHYAQQTEFLCSLLGVYCMGVYTLVCVDM